MIWTRDNTVEVILRNGPFDRALVENWPDEMRRDYFELMAIDLVDLGPGEFKRQAQFLGETYLMSFNEPIGADPILLASWWSLTDGEPPPPQPQFSFVELTTPVNFLQVFDLNSSGR